MDDPALVQPSSPRSWRDSQLYRDLPGMNLATFEEYVQTVSGLNYRYALDVITSSMTCKVIAESGSGIPEPETKSQADAIRNIANILGRKFAPLKRQATSANAHSYSPSSLGRFPHLVSPEPYPQE